MKKKIIVLKTLVLMGFLLLGSCGTIVISSRPNVPPPPWFYPNRIETVRYVYFPDYLIYYDLSVRNYIYLENGVWITVDALPARFSVIDFQRSRFIHIRDYHGDQISTYHSNLNRGQSNLNSRVTRGRTNSSTRRNENVPE
jgi:hypothetical protein